MLYPQFCIIKKYKNMIQTQNFNCRIKRSFIFILFIFLTIQAFAQDSKSESEYKQLIYIEADPLAYINRGYSIHLGYENWGMRFDLTRVEVDFPIAFEEGFYGTSAFDFKTNISGIKLDYIGNRQNWTKNAFIGLDINYQNQEFAHRETLQHVELGSLFAGVRVGWKLPIYKGLYVTPWAAVWKNLTSSQSFTVGEDTISTLEWDLSLIHI